jgi:hypothetical protein
MRTQSSQTKRIDSRRRKTKMQKKTIRHASEVKLFVALVLATCVFATAVSAQPRFEGRFTLPYEVHWGQTVLAAGEYTIFMNPSQAAAVVRSASGKTQFIRATVATENNKKGVNCLIITARGNEHRVRSLNLPGLGQSLIYERLTKSERETVAKTDQAVPVIIAAK